MLALTIREDEGVTVTLPDGRKMRVYAGRFSHQNGHRRVCLLFDAPRDVLILRNELLTREGDHPRPQPPAPPAGRECGA